MDKSTLYATGKTPLEILLVGGVYTFQFKNKQPLKKIIDIFKEHKQSIDWMEYLATALKHGEKQCFDTLKEMESCMGKNETKEIGKLFRYSVALMSQDSPNLSAQQLAQTICEEKYNNRLDLPVEYPHIIEP